MRLLVLVVKSFCVWSVCFLHPHKPLEAAAVASFRIASRQLRPTVPLDPIFHCLQPPCTV